MKRRVEADLLVAHAFFLDMLAHEERRRKGKLTREELL
jgi:hypothetical protein